MPTWIPKWSQIQFWHIGELGQRYNTTIVHVLILTETLNDFKSIVINPKSRNRVLIEFLFKRTAMRTCIAICDN